MQVTKNLLLLSVIRVYDIQNIQSELLQYSEHFKKRLSSEKAVLLAVKI